MANNPYNTVQLGINDTPLTFAIQKGDFKAAEKLILENSEPSFLDEGKYFVAHNIQFHNAAFPFSYIISGTYYVAMIIVNRVMQKVLTALPIKC